MNKFLMIFVVSLVMVAVYFVGMVSSWSWSGLRATDVLMLFILATLSYVVIKLCDWFLNYSLNKSQRFLGWLNLSMTVVSMVTVFATWLMVGGAS